MAEDGRRLPLGVLQRPRAVSLQSCRGAHNPKVASSDPPATIEPPGQRSRVSSSGPPSRCSLLRMLGAKSVTDCIRLPRAHSKTMHDIRAHALDGRPSGEPREGRPETGRSSGQAFCLDACSEVAQRPERVPTFIPTTGWTRWTCEPSVDTKLVWLDVCDLGRRFVRTYTIFEGTSEIQRLVIARAISGLHIP